MWPKNKSVSSGNAPPCCFFSNARRQEAIRQAMRGKPEIVAGSDVTPDVLGYLQAASLQFPFLDRPWKNPLAILIELRSSDKLREGVS